MKYDLGWGESVAVREAFLSTLGGSSVTFDNSALQDLGYPEHEGDPRLIELTRQIIKRNFGRDYNHILITNGATGGVTIALRSLAKSYEYCIVRPPPYFRFYPSMIQAAGLQILERDNNHVDGVYLVDSLSNPEGKFSSMERNDLRSPIVWDGVYFGNVYAPGIHPKPVHDVLVGSYSKLTGLNGLRVGWIACNDPSGYQIMKRLVTAEYCGISAASTKIILDTAGRMNPTLWTIFEKTANYKLDFNRGEWSKLEKYFGNVPVNKYGMFYYAPTDKSCRRLLEKSGVIWSPGSHLGTSDDFGRFNLGQDCRLIKNAVKAILDTDKR